MGGLNLKSWCLLVGLLVGGAIGYLTRPQVTEIKVGNTSVEVSADHKVSSKPFEHMTGDELHELSFAAFGGIIALLTGFIIELRRSREPNNG